MTAPAFPDGIDAAVWEEVDELAWQEQRRAGRLGIYIEATDRVAALWLLRRESTPTMPVLPTEPGAVRITTLLGAEYVGMWDGVSWVSVPGGAVHRSQIESVVRLTTHAESATAFGVEELREAVKKWGRAEISDAMLAATAANYLARVDKAVQG